MTDTEAAWAAGLFDGEGCIMISSNNHRWYRLTVKIGMCHKPALEKLNRLWPGRFRRKLPTHYSKKVAWYWILESKNAAQFLKVICPYSVVKRDEIELALQFHNRPRPAACKKHTQDTLEFMEWCRVSMKELKNQEWLQ